VAHVARAAKEEVVCNQIVIFGNKKLTQITILSVDSRAFPK